MGANSASGGLAVISEIYYPEGWALLLMASRHDTMRGPNYVLRAIEIPAGKHSVEFTFAPKSYVIGDKNNHGQQLDCVACAIGCYWVEFQEGEIVNAISPVSD